jgi:FkbM family methyltransferase
VKKWVHFLTPKEFFQLLVYKFGSEITHLSGYGKTVKSITAELQELLKEGYKISRKGKAICINGINAGDNFKYLIRTGTADKKVFDQVMLYGEYQPMVEVIKSKGEENSVKKIVDAGSNIGLTSIFFKKNYPAAIIMSIEADENNFNHQKKNIELNGFKNTVKLFRNALWKNNTDILYISNDFRDGESWSKSVSLDQNGNSSVKALTIRDIKNLYNKEDIIDILKIDVEGAEAELFSDQDFVMVLKTSVKFLCLEIHDELNIRQKIYETFSKIDFSYQAIGEVCFCVNNNLISK